MEQPLGGLMIEATARYMTADDWVAHRKEISRLYRDEDKTLKETMSAIEAQYGLKATVKMWKNKVTEWGFDKKNKRADVEAMLRKKHERAAVGKDTVFKLRGRDVNFRDVQRHAARNHICATKIAELLTSHPRTPPDLQCLTPPSISRSVTERDVCYIQESILRDLKCYIVGSSENTTWAFDKKGYGLSFPLRTTALSWRLQESGSGFFDAIASVGISTAGQRSIEAALHLSSACAKVGDLVRLTAGPSITQIFGYERSPMIERNKRILSQHILNMARALLPANDPRCQLYCKISQLESTQSSELYREIFQLVTDQLETLGGQHHYVTLIRKIAALELRHGPGVLHDWLSTTLTSLEAMFGVYDPRAIYVLYKKAYLSYRLRDCAAAEAGSRRVLERLSLLLAREPMHMVFRWLDQRATSLYAHTLQMQGDYDAAMNVLSDGLLRAEAAGYSIDAAVRIQSELEDVLRKTGNIHEAEWLRAHRMAHLEKHASL